MTYEELLNESQNKNIDIIEMKFKGNLKGLYGDNLIALNKDIETVKEKKCILAEELGHHYTSSSNILDTRIIGNLKQEKRAKNWAYEKLIGITNLISAYKAGTKNKYELAEYLNVTEEFLEEALNHYKEKYGLYFQIDTYLIYFDPLIVVEMF